MLPQCEVLPPRESGENCVRFEEFIDSGEEGMCMLLAQIYIT